MFQTFGLFQILDYLHRQNEMSWEWDSTLNTKFIYASYIIYTVGLNIILSCVFGTPAF
jgi:hypothetical protein